MDIATLYRLMKSDSRLQKDWERNQPRMDRSFEAPLIARTPREVATAALLAIKLRFEPKAAPFITIHADPDLLAFAKTQGNGGTRLANILLGTKAGDAIAHAAAFHALQFYRCRATACDIIRMVWSDAALRAIADCSPNKLFNPALLPTWADRKAKGVVELAQIVMNPDATALTDDSLREMLRGVPGLGPERADAVGVFAFRKPWPIVDEYLWMILATHGILSAEEMKLQGYSRRRAAFQRYWDQLLAAFPDAPNELAATLYLWADEVGRFGYKYP